MDQLSPRQIECLQLSATMTDKEIARRLGLSPHTVNQHIRDAMRRLSVSSRKAALRALPSNPLPPEIGMASEVRPAISDPAIAGRREGPEQDGATDERSLFGAYSRLGRWRTPPRFGGTRLPVILGWTVVGIVVLIVLSGLMNALFGSFEALAPGAS